MRKIAVVAAAVAVAAFFIFRALTRPKGLSESEIARQSAVGLSTRDITQADYSAMPHLEQGAKAAVVYAVHAYHIAEKAGLKSGDLILSLNGVETESAAEYEEALEQALETDRLEYRIQRASGVETIRFSLDYGASFNSIGAALMREGKLDEAEAAFQRALTLEPNFAEAHYNLGNLNLERGDVETAVSMFQKAVEADPNMREARYQLGEAYAQLEQYERAIDTFKQLISVAPPMTAERELRPAHAATALTGEVLRQIEASGEVEAEAHAAVYPKAQGVIVKMAAEEGDRVQKGDILAVIEHEELKIAAVQAKASLEAASAAYVQAQKLAKTTALAQLKQAEAGAALARASMAQVNDISETRARAQTEQAQAGLEALRANLSKLKSGLREEEKLQALAARNQARSALTSAESERERVKALFEGGAVSLQTFDLSTAQLDAAQAQFDAAEQGWVLAQKGAREEDISALAAQVDQAEAALRLAKAQLETQTWEKDAAMSQAQVDQAAAALLTAQASVDAESWRAEIAAAKASLAQAQAASDLAEKRVRDASVRAPIGGVVSKRMLDLGGRASLQQPLFEIHDQDAVTASAPILEADIAWITPGLKARAYLSALAEPVEGVVASVSPSVDPRTRTATVEIALDNPGGAVKPGMFARAAIDVETRADAVLAPRDALVTKESLFVARDGRAHLTQVEVGLTFGNAVEILSGVQPGDAVLFIGQTSLRDGDFIQIVRSVDDWRSAP